MKKENNAIIITSIISVVVLVIAIAALMTFNSFSPSTKNTITVEGISSIDATPDLMTVYYSIETKGNTSAEAKNAEEVIYNKLLSAIQNEGFAKADLKTQSFNIYPDYVWDGQKQKDNGFKAVHSLKLELQKDDFDKIGEAVNAGVDSGAGISYINFELTQESQNKYKIQALGLASKDAQAKADAVASGFGKTAGRLISVQVNEFGYYPWNVYTAGGSSSSVDMKLAQDAAVNIAPSDQKINARISATFGI
jgi:uncharacterized protein